MTTPNTSTGSAASGSNTGLMASLYSHVGNEALVGAFVAGDTPSRSAMLNLLQYEKLPDDLLEAAIEVKDEEVLWALSQRVDIPDSALRKLIASKSPLVHRKLASSPQLKDRDLRKILNNDRLIMTQVFMHPNASRDLRLKILKSSDSQGELLSTTSVMEREVQKPEYARWMLGIGTQSARVNALSHVGDLPAAYQWDMAMKIVDGAVPLGMVLKHNGWAAPLQAAFTDALAAEQQYSTDYALGMLKTTLKRLDRPVIDAADEARLLVDVAEVDALEQGEPVDWSALEKQLRNGEMTLPAVRYLMHRSDRTQGFVSAAIVFHGDQVGVMDECELSDLKAAVRMTGFAPGERSRLVKLFVYSPQLHYSFIDLVGDLPFDDVLHHLQQADEELQTHQVKRLGAELRELLGEDPSVWHDFESARKSSSRGTLNDAIRAAVEGAE